MTDTLPFIGLTEPQLFGVGLVLAAAFILLALFDFQPTPDDPDE